MSSEVVSAILETILESIEMVEARFSRIHHPDDLVSSPDGVTILDAISMRLQVIGEQTKKLEKIDQDLLASIIDIEWDKIMKLRDLISHHYEKMDHEVVYDICENHIPKLKKAIQSLTQKKNS
jgi:uncharacterized protein with HEPN domain